MTVAKKTAAKPTAAANPKPGPAQASAARALKASNSPPQAPPAAFQGAGGELCQEGISEPSADALGPFPVLAVSVDGDHVYATAEVPDSVLIHFVRDGVSAFGYSWSAGQELELVKGSPEFAETLDRNGYSWMEVTEEDQLSTFGHVRHRPGPSPIPNPVLNYTVNALDTPVANRTSEDQTRFGDLYFSEKSLKAAARDELERGRGVPKRYPVVF